MTASDAVDQVAFYTGLSILVYHRYSLVALGFALVGVGLIAMILGLGGD